MAGRMIDLFFPTSEDIYLEVNGRRMAVVESYRARSTRRNRYVEAFGEEEPVGVSRGPLRHEVELSRVRACSEAGDGVNFCDLDDFNLVIVKPDRRIVYTGCRWSSLEESAGLERPVLEHVSLTAVSRMELL